ncbi:MULTISPECIES: AAA family ATPase [Sporosarcina]|uniref:AAA family ATPase n=1 Tax=Sporosarcina TaxID=1569 RepID=UPI00058ACFEB|nr:MULTISPECIES: MoxR family ATPase [Sporosarcina]WJY27388.1 MoxR family ATPase [Sporosarcina sp. 0.2-SM1T-5]
MSHKEKIDAILSGIERTIVGKREISELSLTALLAGGHVLLEDVPGVGKTVMVKALAASIGAEFKRIQFTPDLLPSDVLGVSIYNPQAMEFEFRPGPIVGNIVLADEINRTSPKTQAALLEGMEEAAVTVDGRTLPLPEPFFVMATQNPIEYEGTYPLPEAQMDRFLFKLKMGYPSRTDEIEVLSRAEAKTGMAPFMSVIGLDELRGLQAAAADVLVDSTVKTYIVDCAAATRAHHAVYLGVSPRGSLGLMRACQAYALLRGRSYVTPDDVQYLLPFVFGHRLILQPDAQYGGRTVESVLEDVLAQVRVPIVKASTV